MIVEALDFGGDGKVARKMQDKLKTILPDASLFLASLDDDLTKYCLTHQLLFSSLTG